MTAELDGAPEAFTGRLGTLRDQLAHVAPEQWWDATSLPSGDFLRARALTLEAAASWRQTQADVDALDARITAARTATRTGAAALLGRRPGPRQVKLEAIARLETREVRKLIALAYAAGHGPDSGLGHVLHGTRYLCETLVSIAAGDPCVAGAGAQLAHHYLARATR